MGYYDQYDRKMEKLYDSTKPIFGKEIGYKTDERLEKTDLPLFPREPKTKEVIREVVVIKKRAIPKFDDELVMPLKKISPQIIGSIFDRVIFLEQRISEIKNSMQLRERLHNDIIKSIDEDIKEKERMVNSISDMDEKRNLKLDISLLMKEKRKEHLEFWRDTYTLGGELRELLESYQTEKKVANIFSDLNENNGKAVTGE